MVSVDALIALLIGDYDDGGVLLTVPPRKASIGAIIVMQLCKQLKPGSADQLKNRIYGERMGWGELDYRDAYALQWGWNDWVRAGRPIADPPVGECAWTDDAVRAA